MRWNGVVLRRNRGDSDAKCALTLARQVGLAGRGGRGDDGGAASELDWVVVQRRWCTSGWSTVAVQWRAWSPRFDMEKRVKSERWNGSSSSTSPGSSTLAWHHGANGGVRAPHGGRTLCVVGHDPC